MHGRCVPLQEEQTRKSIVYPSIPSPIAPVARCEDLPIPKPSVLESPFSASISSEEDTDADFDKAGTSKEPHFPNQHKMNDLIRDMGLTNKNPELLTSRLKKWHLLDPTSKVSKYKKRHLNLAHFFTLS